MDARAVIETLRLQPHPEGGWYRETWRAAGTGGERGAGTAIHFLLEPGGRSHWHRVDAVELWLHQAGGPLRLLTAEPGAAPVERVLGADLAAGQMLQVVVQTGEWQAAEALDGWALAACVVVPAFEFAGFELAPPGWEPTAGL